MNKALFLDRDGIVNRTILRYNEKYRRKIDDSPFSISELNFAEGIKELTDYARKKNYQMIIVTNQPSILKGEFSLKAYEDITTKICKYLKMQRADIFECMHKEGLSLECNCRKPKPGLFLMAKGMHNIDLGNSYMIGDSWKDIKAAEDACVGKTIFLRREKSKAQIGNIEDELQMKKLRIKPNYVINALEEAITILK